MDDKLMAALLGIITGMAGYWFTTFWMKPILRYREIRSQILVDLIFYAQVVNPDRLNEQMQTLYEERIQSNRRRSADLHACLLELPIWYISWLHMRGCSPKRAAELLMGFSNTREYDEAAERVKGIKAALCIRTEVV